MPLDAAEKQRVRYHLGYPALTDNASVAFGVPMLNQTNFLVETALNNLLEVSLDRIRAMVQTMDDIESKMIEAQERLAATQLEDLHLNNGEIDQLENEYRRWGFRLADTIGAPVYWLSPRYKGAGGSQITSIPIRRG